MYRLRIRRPSLISSWVSALFKTHNSFIMCEYPPVQMVRHRPLLMRSHLIRAHALFLIWDALKSIRDSAVDDERSASDFFSFMRDSLVISEDEAQSGFRLRRTPEWYRAGHVDAHERMSHELAAYGLALMSLRETIGYYGLHTYVGLNDAETMYVYEYLSMRMMVCLVHALESYRRAHLADIVRIKLADDTMTSAWPMLDYSMCAWRAEPVVHMEDLQRYSVHTWKISVFFPLQFDALRAASQTLEQYAHRSKKDLLPDDAFLYMSAVAVLSKDVGVLSKSHRVSRTILRRTEGLLRCADAYMCLVNSVTMPSMRQSLSSDEFGVCLSGLYLTDTIQCLHPFLTRDVVFRKRDMRDDSDRARDVYSPPKRGLR